MGYKRVKGGRAGAGRGIAVTVTIIRFWIVPPLGPRTRFCVIFRSTPNADIGFQRTICRDGPKGDIDWPIRPGTVEEIALKMLDHLKQ